MLTKALEKERYYLTVPDYNIGSWEDKMERNINKLIVLILTGIISIVDIFNNGNGYLQLILAFCSSFIVFYMPHLPYKLKKLPFTLLLIANIIVLALTFNHRVLLINMLLLSYLIWGIITPKLLRFKSFLSITFILTFISVYAAAFAKFSIPLFIFVFYPVYVLGASLKDRNILKSKKIWLFALFNLAFSALLLAVFMYKSLGQSILGSISFLNFDNLGTVSAVYLPFIAIFLVWFTASCNLIFYMLTSKSENHTATFDLTLYMKAVYNFISFFAIAVIATFVCEFSIRQSLSATFVAVLRPNIIFNILFLCSIYLCLISIIGKGISNILIAILTIFLTVANYIKFTYFEEPFYPWDMYLIRDLISISKNYINAAMIIAASLTVIVAIILIVRFRRPIGKCLRPRVSIILIPFAAALLLLNVNVLLHSSLSTQIGIQKSWYIGRTEILSNGVFAQNYFYLNDLNKYLNPKPDGYSEKQLHAINKKYENQTGLTASTTTTNLNVKPNVIVIMSESYWDITKLSGITFSEDVTANVHKYQKGELATPAIGGGTCNSEFEALTGMSMYFMSPGIYPYNAYLRTVTPSIATVFKNNGYNTTAIHPNSGSFYNRNKVYKNFGFEEFLDVDSFDMETETKGPHISDDAMVNKILGTLNSSDDPNFIFAVSMENHDPFDDKYAEDEFDVTTQSDKLDASHKEIVSGYAQGIYDADRSLGKLIDELNKSDKPTLLYFYGDHAPRLGSLDDYYRIYDQLAKPNKQEQEQNIGDLKYYTTPYVSWSNYQEMRSFSKIMSPSHLSYEILKDSGVKYPSYFNILSQLEEKYPIMHLKGLNLVDANDELVKDYKLIQYDLLFGKKYLSDVN